MNYKDYEIKAEVETYETWSLDEQGNIKEMLDNTGYCEVTGYFFLNEKTGDDFFQDMSASDAETLHSLIDERIEELAKAVV